MTTGQHWNNSQPNEWEGNDYVDNDDWSIVECDDGSISNIEITDADLQSLIDMSESQALNDDSSFSQGRSPKNVAPRSAKKKSRRKDRRGSPRRYPDSSASHHPRQDRIGQGESQGLRKSPSGFESSSKPHTTEFAHDVHNDLHSLRKLAPREVSEQRPPEEKEDTTSSATEEEIMRMILEDSGRHNITFEDSMGLLLREEAERFSEIENSQTFHFDAAATTNGVATTNFAGPSATLPRLRNQIAAQRPTLFLAQGEPLESDRPDDIGELYMLCLATKPTGDSVNITCWEPVRNYMFTNSQVEQASYVKDGQGMTALHHVCCHQPPVDIIELFVSVTGLQALSQADMNGRLPLHHACMHNAGTGVVTALVQLYPESKIMQDVVGHATPLHQLFTSHNGTSADTVQVLCSEEAAAIQDKQGMLPLHHALRKEFSGDPVAIKILMNFYPQGLSQESYKGSMPIQYVLRAAHERNAPDLLDFAYALDPNLVNSGRMGVRALKTLGRCARDYAGSECVQQCFNILLQHMRDPSDEFMVKLASIPTWLHLGRKR